MLGITERAKLTVWVGAGAPSTGRPTAVVTTTHAMTTAMSRMTTFSLIHQLVLYLTQCTDKGHKEVDIVRFQCFQFQVPLGHSSSMIVFIKGIHIGLLAKEPSIHVFVEAAKRKLSFVLSK